MSIVRRFLNLWRERSLDRDFNDELRFHTEMRVDANMRGGMSRPEAEAEAGRLAALGLAAFALPEVETRAAEAPHLALGGTAERDALQLQ